MSEAEQLSSLIGDIYDAALDQSLWVDVLRRAMKFVGAQGSSLFSRDAVSKSADIHHAFGVAPDYLQLYVDTYARLDPSTMTMFFSEVGQVASIVDQMVYDEFVKSRFYQEWARPQGWWVACQRFWT